MSHALFYLARENNSNALQRYDSLPEDINLMHLELALMLMLLRMESQVGDNVDANCCPGMKQGGSS